MFKLLFLKEARHSLQDARYGIFFSFILILIVAAFLNGFSQYLRQYEVYTYRNGQLPTELTGGKTDYLTLASTGVHIPLPPRRLQFIARGTEDYQDKRAHLSRAGLPFINDYGEPNMLQKSFIQKMDIPFIVIFILSLISLIYAHSVFCDERDQGTLRLILANPVSRTGMLLSKICAAFTGIAAPMAISFVLIVVILQLHSSYALTFGDMADLAGALALSCLFLFFFFLAGTAIAVLSPSSSVSITLQVTFWIAVTIISHNLAASFLNSRSQAVKEITSHDSFYASVKQDIDNAVNRKCNHFITRHYPGQRVDTEILKKLFTFQLGIYAAEYPRAINAYINKTAAFSRHAYAVTVLSPTLLYQKGMAVICGTDTDNTMDCLYAVSKHFKWFLELMQSRISERLRSNAGYKIDEDPVITEKIQLDIDARPGRNVNSILLRFCFPLVFISILLFLTCLLAINRKSF